MPPAERTGGTTSLCSTTGVPSSTKALGVLKHVCVETNNKGRKAIFEYMFAATNDKGREEIMKFALRQPISFENDSSDSCNDDS